MPGSVLVALTTFMTSSKLSQRLCLTDLTIPFLDEEAEPRSPCTTQNQPSSLAALQPLQMLEELHGTQ